MIQDTRTGIDGCAVELVPLSLAWPGGVDVGTSMDAEGDVPVGVGGGWMSGVKSRFEEGKKRRARANWKGKARAMDLDVEWCTV